MLYNFNCKIIKYLKVGEVMLIKSLYMLSIVFLLIAFLLYPKENKKLNLLSWIVYTLGILVCYNTFIVCLIAFLKQQGSLPIYSTINYIVGSILFIISIKKNQFQKYTIHLPDIITFLCISLISIGIGYFRFNGFSAISYQSGDSAAHYRHALHFSEELSLLNKTNSQDILYGNFERVMPISYINGGLFLHLFSNIKPYQAFLIYDTLCYLLSSLLFLTTLTKIYSPKKGNYLYLFILTHIYILGFPLNSFLFGFCYLGLGLMVVNLLFLTILNFEGKLQQDRIFKLTILFLLNFSVFFSYYLFIPCIYLALGLYYILLWKKKKWQFKDTLLYGTITLIIPFIIGFTHFLIPLFGKNQGSILTVINLDGDIYRNITPIYVFAIVFCYLLFDKIKNKRKLDYFYLNLYTIAGYIVIFLVLYALHYAQIYYLYKLFYLYWIFEILLLGKLLANKRVYLYTLFTIVISGFLYVTFFPTTSLTNLLIRVNVYNWNAKAMAPDQFMFNKKELELVEKSTKYKSICEHNHEFLLVGDKRKNFWFYSITGSVPVLEDDNGWNIEKNNITLGTWQNLDEYNCVIYYYDNAISYYDKFMYDVLYENEEGIILKKK